MTKLIELYNTKKFFLYVNKTTTGCGKRCKSDCDKQSKCIQINHITTLKRMGNKTDLCNFENSVFSGY